MLRPVLLQEGHNTREEKVFKHLDNRTEKANGAVKAALIFRLTRLQDGYDQGHTAIVAIVAIATLCRAISLALQGNFKTSRANLHGNFKISLAPFQNFKILTG
jgi:hypothetical protein